MNAVRIRVYPSGWVRIRIHVTCTYNVALKIFRKLVLGWFWGFFNKSKKQYISTIYQQKLNASVKVTESKVKVESDLVASTMVQQQESMNCLGLAFDFMGNNVGQCI